MPYNPAGLFSLVASYFAEPGTTIRTEQHNPVFEDVGSALSNVVIRDGRAPMIGPLNMNGNPILNVAAGNTPSSVATLGQGIPIGAWIDFGGDTAPSGWMLCDGRAVSRTIYSLLFTAIGTKFGAGNGTTTFNIPKLNGRTTFGRDDMGGTAAGILTTENFGSDPKVVGNVGGGQSTTLITANLPPYTPSGSISNGGISQNLNNYGVNAVAVGWATGGNGGYIPSAPGNPSFYQGQSTFFGNAQGGTSTPFRTVPPGVIANKIIRVSYDG